MIGVESVRVESGVKVETMTTRWMVMGVARNVDNDDIKSTTLS
jgi:hypothetical protein